MNKSLSKEELDSILQIKESYDKIVPEIGTISIQIYELESKLDQLNKDKRDYLSTYYQIQNKEQELSKLLSDKYGSCQIDLTTGQIS